MFKLLAGFSLITFVAVCVMMAFFTQGMTLLAPAALVAIWLHAGMTHEE